MKRAMLILCFWGLFVPGLRAQEWNLIWSDEFDYEGLPDTRKWNYEVGFVRNKEMQYYTHGRLENVRVEDGVLLIVARKEEFNNPKFKKDSRKWQEQRQIAHYTSGSINTLNKASFKYGRIEVRAKMPRGRGMWSAIWMMGTNRVDKGWPQCGEIDIMEYVGKRPHTIHANGHFADPDSRNKAIPKSAGHGKITIAEPYEKFHVYAVEWNHKKIKFFVDEKQYSVLNIDVAGKGPDNPFRKPFYLLLNLAIGGTWGGQIDDSVFPQKYEIDYVRVFNTE